jgi:hypothetical protein
MIYGIADFTLQTLQRIPPARRLPASWTHVETAITLPESHVLRFNPSCLWELRPGAQYQGIEINEYGFRGAPPPREKVHGVRIAALGDSATLGLNYGGSDAESWPRQLETLLSKGGIPAEVLNFGIPCFTAAQGAEWYRERGREWQADLLLVSFGAFSESNPAAAGRTDVEEIARSRGWSERATRFFDRFGLCRYIKGQLSPDDPAAAGGSGAVTAIGTMHGSAPSAAPAIVRLPIPQFEASLEAIVGMQKADRHQTALITPIRTGGLIAKRPAAAEYDQAIRRVANKTGVPVLEVGPYFRRLTEPGNAPARFAPESEVFADLYHPSQSGSVYWASFVNRELRASA